VGAIVANEDVGDSETGEDNLLKKLSDHSGVIGGTSKGFHPFGHIIHGDQDVFVPPGGWKRVHEIQAANIEYFDLKNVVKGNFIPP